MSNNYIVHLTYNVILNANCNKKLQVHLKCQNVMNFEKGINGR